MNKPKSWDEMDATERTDWLRGELKAIRQTIQVIGTRADKDHAQIGSLEDTILEIGDAVKDLEEKLGSNK